MEKDNYKKDLQNNVPVLSDNEIKVVNHEINDLHDSLFKRGNDLLDASPSLTARQLAIKLAQEDLSNSKKLSFKRIVLYRIIKALKKG